jgi:hypothetical protein
MFFLALAFRAQVLPGAVNSIEGLGTQVALSTVFPNEQIITGKFGSPGDQDEVATAWLNNDSVRSAIHAEPV